MKDLIAQTSKLKAVFLHRLPGSSSKPRQPQQNPHRSSLSLVRRTAAQRARDSSQREQNRNPERRDRAGGQETQKGIGGRKRHNTGK